jgi:alpha-glucuronidase
MKYPRPDRPTREAYRKLFNTYEGRLVLTHMLNELCFYGDSVENDEERTLSNYARHLLTNIGVWRDANNEDMTSMMFKIYEKPYPEEGA